jgi:hypothetical protein
MSDPSTVTYSPEAAGEYFPSFAVFSRMEFARSISSLVSFVLSELSWGSSVFG